MAYCLLFSILCVLCCTVHHLSRYCNNALPLFSIQWKLKQNRENHFSKWIQMYDFTLWSVLKVFFPRFTSLILCLCHSPGEFHESMPFQQTAPFLFHIRNLERTMENLFSPRITSLKFGFQSIFIIFFIINLKSA